MLSSTNNPDDTLICVCLRLDGGGGESILWDLEGLANQVPKAGKFLTFISAADMLLRSGRR